MKAWIFIERETPTQMFFCEYCEIFKNSFLWNTFCSLYFSKIYVMIEFSGCLRVQNYIFHVSCANGLFFFITLVLELGIYSYFFCTCFHIKNFCKCNFCKHCNVGFSSILLIELLKFRNIPRIIMLSPGFLL